MPVTTQNQYSVPTQANLSAAGTDHHSNGMVESPELLRWRADMLLDEMLLGGADLGAGQHTNGAHSNGHHVNGSHANGSQPYPDNGNYPANTHHVPSNSIDPAPQHVTPSASYGNDLVPDSASRTTIQNAQVNASATAPAAQPLLVSAEQRYARLAQPSPSTPPTVANTVAQDDLHAAMEQDVPTSNGLGPVRRSNVNGSASAGTMSVANRGSKYSTLLPRESNVDPELLQSEIASLSQQLATEMPPRHESRERAQKLLDKANTILQSDPLRSAEVDYYLQQVRSMIDRLRQSLNYSALYESRLRTYLFAWLALALIVLLGCMLYGRELISAISALANWGENSIGAQHLVAFLSTLFAGGLGGTLCAFWSLRTQPYREAGFLDRKFSLRSMILPITGFVAGLFIYLLLGLVYWGLALNPSHNLAITLLPMLLTFALASAQELLFGVRS